MLFEIDNSIYSGQSYLVLRLEDIKKQPEKLYLLFANGWALRKVRACMK
jgi:hypothetical protein